MAVAAETERPMRIIVACVVILSTPGLAPLAAQTPSERGRALVQQLDERARGYGDFEATLTMRILRGDGERQRQMRVRGLESADGDRTRIVLERPADLAGTEFLSVAGADGQRAQWIYLRSARRVRMIAGAQSSDSFLGSHFTFDDMTPPSIEGYSYRWVRDEEIAGRAGALVERVREDGSGAYPRQLLAIDTERALLLGVEFFDAQGRRRRHLMLEEHREIDGFWQATRMTMTEVDTGERTVLEWTDIRIGVGLTRSDFEPSRLGR
jgi:outer membrane lipoprotein-sorting protein